VPTSPVAVTRVWSSVLVAVVVLASCARGNDLDARADPFSHDGASAGDSVVTGGTSGTSANGAGGSVDPTGVGGFGGAVSTGGSSGGSGNDSVDAAMSDPETGADAQTAVDVAVEVGPPDTGIADVGADVSVIGPDITAMGTIVAFVPMPTGGGNKNLEVIRDGVFPPVNSTDSNQQFDSFKNDPNRTEDWIGYTFASTITFARVVFQDGKRFVDGGWFTTLKVQVRQANVWVDVPGMVSTPAYLGMNSPNYSTYQLDFPPISGDGIRIDGAPGGTMKFISVGELRVFRAGP
jgi:hypothetical protein